MLPRALVAALLTLAAPAAAGCGSDEQAPGPDKAVRRSAGQYLDALIGGRWADACRRMTPDARAVVGEERGGAGCEAALSAGEALPAEVLAGARREIAGAPVRIAGPRAELGPVADLPVPLRFERRDGRWLVAP